MKEGTGELNMTVITVIAIGAVAALSYAFLWPIIQRTIVQQTCNTYGPGYTAKKVEAGESSACTTASDKTSCWICECDAAKGCTGGDIKAD